jgi:hypothetical protein
MNFTINKKELNFEINFIFKLNLIISLKVTVSEFFIQIKYENLIKSFEIIKYY